MGIEHQTFGHTHQADVIDLGLHRQIHAHVYARQVNHQLFGNDHAQVQVANGQAHGLGVDGVGLFDAAVVVAVVEVAARLAALNGRHTNETIGVVDAYGQGGDDGLRTVAQGDGFAALLGKGHGSRQLHKAGQVDLGVAHLGLDDFLGEVEEDHVVAAGRQGKAGAVYAPVLVAVFAQVKLAIVVAVFA